jgi:hypothetical protein
MHKAFSFKLYAAAMQSAALHVSSCFSKHQEKKMQCLTILSRASNALLVVG